MNRCFKSLGMIVLLCASFYYTHQFALLMKSKDPIYQSILLSAKEKQVASLSATIDGDYIVPGIDGLKVNVDKSFQKMKSLGAFLESYLVFDEEMPTVSLNNNMDKIINKGNSVKQSVSFIIDENSNLASYFDKQHINYAYFATLKTAKDDVLGEKINIDEKNYNEVDKILNKKNDLANIYCPINILSKDFCKSKGKIMIMPTVEINKLNFASLQNSIVSGSIIYIKNLDVSLLKLLIENLVYKNYSIVNLSYLLSEKR